MEEEDGGKRVRRRKLENRENKLERKIYRFTKKVEKEDEGK